jgi:hypothetical protein
MKLILATILVITSLPLLSQSGNSTCINAIRICLNEPVSYPAATGAGPAETGPDYGCLGSEPNPAWFSFSIDNPGTHTILQTNSGNRDLDFILFGPFENETGNCTDLTAENTADCSYAGGTTETINFTSVNQGDFYLLMVTNFSNQSTNVTFTQTDGTGTYDCNFTGVCQISLVSAIPGSCDTTSNTYTLGGSVFTFNPPSTGTLTVSSGGETQILNAPFTNPVQFSIPGLPSNAAASNVSAVFSASTSCTGSANFTAPSSCTPCLASAIANGPICSGGDLQLTTDYPALADYFWTGPNGFSSENPNPVISDVTVDATGIYSVLIVGDACVSEREVEVEIIDSPEVIITTVEDSICSGEIIFLGAVEIPGAEWLWQGPNNFTAAARNTQINDAGTQESGWYSLQATRGGCAGNPDSVFINVFETPIITLNGDTMYAPGSTGLFYIDGPEGMTYYWNFFGDAALMDVQIYTEGGDSLVAFWQEREGDMRIEVIGLDENGCFSMEASLPVYVVDMTGLNNIEAESLISVSPNPADEETLINNIGKSPLNISVLDISGRNFDVFQIGANSSYLLSTLNLPSGMYFLRNENHTQKLIITHP